MLVLPNMSLPGAIHRADALREAFRSRRVRFGALELKSTLSMGVAQYPADGETAGQLLGAADEALYRAKRSGRDRVCSASLPAPA
ncbi:MAG: diguanylate cyclase [Burkholderiales bacterium]|nr:diguanylate cyclase [Burkholderiales bacterium]